MVTFLHGRAIICVFIQLMGVVSPRRLNVLFLMSDDMRPQLGCYNGTDFPSPVHPKMYTPNLDKLASRSLLLKRAYVQQAWCSPSRTSLLTGRRPDTTHVYDLKTYFRQSGGNFTTIPQYFKQNGYLSIGMGKIFHPNKASGHDDPISWSRPYYHAPNLKYWDEKERIWLPVTQRARKKRPLPDEQLTSHAIKTLREIAPDAREGTQPFFLALGLHKPHVPFVFPEEYLEFYPEEEICVPDNPHAPNNMPAVAWSNCMQQEFGHYKDIRRTHFSGKINASLPLPMIKALRRAYYASVSYVDALLGDVVAELDHLGLSNSTIVTFMGDHGWQLGEHGEWCKHTNFELATHAPVMVRVPGTTDRGIISEALTEFVDLFPTLAEVAGLPLLPLCPLNSSNVSLCSEGLSMMPLINPSIQIKWKQRVFSQYPRKVGYVTVMGYTMRTGDFRYTQWVRFQGKPVYRPIWEDMYGEELYDHRTDPEENINQVDAVAYTSTLVRLRKLLHMGWRNAIPMHI